MNSVLNFDIIFTFDIQLLRAKMFPQFQMVRDFDLFESQTQEQSRFSALIFHKEEFLKETQENQIEAENCALKTRSSKKMTAPIQTSFDSGFINHHLLAFRKTMERYMENSYPNINQVQGKGRTAEIFANCPEFLNGDQTIKEIVLKDKRLFEEKQKKQFLIDLFYEEKLSEFLTLICNNCNSALALDLIYVANLVWQAYIPKQEIGLSQQEIIKLIDSLLASEKINSLFEKLEFLGFKKTVIAPGVDSEKLNQNLKTFLKKFGTTLLLVVEEYFANPHSKEEDELDTGKRPFNFKDISNDEFSEDQDEYNFSQGTKKIKF